MADAVIVGEAIDESTVRVAATLKGVTDPKVSISRFNDTDCPDPPGVATGERVLLLLGRYHGDFQIFGFGRGKYMLTDGKAKLEYGGPVSAEDLLRHIAAITAAPQDELNAALAFARGETETEKNAEDGGGDLSMLVIGFASGGIVVLALGSFFALTRLRRAT